MKERLRSIIEDAIARREIPGAVVGVVRRDGTRELFAFGGQTYGDESPRVTHDTLYDVASVTKSIPGALILLRLLDDGVLRLTDRVVDYIPEFKGTSGKETVTIQHLLTYTLDLALPPMATLGTKSPEEIMHIVFSAPLSAPPGTRYVYANSTALFLHKIAERVTGEKIDTLAKKFFFGPMGLRDTTFHPEEIPIERITPTEITSDRGLVHGAVHDESTFALRSLGPVAVAGLFSTAPDMLSVLEMLLRDGMLNNERFLSESIAEKIARNQTPNLATASGLGFELDRPWMGKERRQVFGKGGFTGTVIMIHREKGVATVLLSNATYPKRPPDMRSRHALRMAVADLVFE